MRFVLLTLTMLALVLFASAAEKTETVHGYVLDSACAFTKNLNKPISRNCALACAKAGSPLVILGDDGNVYWPISGSTPAAGQNPKLLRFAGERVDAKGRVYDRGGSKAIVIEQITAESKPRSNNAYSRGQQ